MLLLHGEPGIGKTRLVAETVEGLPAGSHQVLWAQCLRLRSDAGSFLPFSGGAVALAARVRCRRARQGLWGGRGAERDCSRDGGGQWVGAGRPPDCPVVVGHPPDRRYWGPRCWSSMTCSGPMPGSLEALAYLVVGPGPGCPVERSGYLPRHGGWVRAIGFMSGLLTCGGCHGSRPVPLRVSTVPRQPTAGPRGGWARGDRDRTPT